MNINQFTTTGQEMLRAAKEAGQDTAIVIDDGRLRVVGICQRGAINEMEGMSGEHQLVELVNIEGL